MSKLKIIQVQNAEAFTSKRERKTTKKTRKKSASQTSVKRSEKQGQPEVFLTVFAVPADFVNLSKNLPDKLVG
ncbi:hypothetical protein M6B38_124095 [Iris pallida]|uniref:Uncharacterized protein n=1 Tax=Iris pallida TaxID=29817 RepID=A0AAX6H2B0_IRIPA|nr:hypothetical protein M6B38_124095 [Iris pallida]